jgi:hypothetical protein
MARAYSSALATIWFACASVSVGIGLLRQERSSPAA